MSHQNRVYGFRVRLRLSIRSRFRHGPCLVVEKCMDTVVVFTALLWFVSAHNIDGQTFGLYAKTFIEPCFMRRGKAFGQFGRLRFFFNIVILLIFIAFRLSWSWHLQSLASTIAFVQVLQIYRCHIFSLVGRKCNDLWMSKVDSVWNCRIGDLLLMILLRSRILVVAWLVQTFVLHFS